MFKFIRENLSDPEIVPLRHCFKYVYLLVESTSWIRDLRLNIGLVFYFCAPPVIEREIIKKIFSFFFRNKFYFVYSSIRTISQINCTISTLSRIVSEKRLRSFECVNVVFVGGDDSVSIEVRDPVEYRLKDSSSSLINVGADTFIYRDEKVEFCIFEFILFKNFFFLVTYRSERGNGQICSGADFLRAI